MSSKIHSLTVILLVSSLALMGSCKNNSTDGDNGNNFDRPAMLSNYGNNTIVPAYLNLQDEVATLESSVNTFVQDPTEANLSALQDDLKAARIAWQEVNLFQFGPAESVTLRTSLNTYPADTSQINSNIDSGSYTLGTIENQAAAGFPTLGYLLHGIGGSNQKILSKYTDDSRASARVAYLKDNISFIKDKVDQATNEWSPDGEDYLAIFLSEENAGTDVGSSLGMLINAMVQHYERFLRDGKVGIPAGVRSAEVTRPSATEAVYGGYSLELAIANLKAVKTLYKGTTRDGMDGLGLEKNLQALDADDLSSEINTELDQAITALEDLSDPLSEQIESNNDPVLSAFQELQDIVVLLKADMTSVLGITITFQDNDGD